MQWIDGDPAVCTIYSTPLALAPSRAVRAAWSLVQHIPVWHLVKAMGFDESEAHNPIAEGQIRAIVSQDGFFHDAPPELMTPFQTVALAFGLSCPATPEIRANLRSAARDMIPEALELAETRVSAFERQPQLSSQGYLDALTDLLCLIKTPTESLRVSFLSNTCPNFRTRILAAANL